MRLFIVITSITVFLCLLAGIGIGIYFLARKKHNDPNPPSNTCQPGQVMYEGSCCTPEPCDGMCDVSNNCGVQCNCPDGQKCQGGFCCTPLPCDGSRCATDCGVTCTCNSMYCSSGMKSKIPEVYKVMNGQSDTATGQAGEAVSDTSNEAVSDTSNECCRNGFCYYSDICSSPAGPFLKKEWGLFCNDCKKCDLSNARFIGESVAPIEGQLHCESCGTGTSVAQVTIDKSATSYIYDAKQNAIIPQYNKAMCDGSTICLTDDDCKRMGCNKCVGLKCT